MIQSGEIMIELSRPWHRAIATLGLLLVFVVCGPSRTDAQSCQTSGDLDAASRSAIDAAAQRYFGMAAKDDATSLRQNSIASLVSDFSGIETTIKDNQQNLAGAQAVERSLFLLDATGSSTLPHAEFYCGVFGKNGQTPGSAVFYLDNLPPGKYAVVALSASSAQGQTNFSVILQQAGSDWKLGGLYIQPAEVAGHDSAWFAARALDYKTKGQLRNAWLYYREARNLISPLPFMSTLDTDKLYDESKGVQPSDVPANGNAADLAAAGTTYKLIALFPAAVGNDVDLVVKYQAADISNTGQTYQTNLAVIRALLTKYPELRDAFAGVVARAVETSGRDYGTLLSMKDAK